MNKRKLIFFIMVVLLTVLFTCIIVISSLGLLSPLHPNCLPIRYPDGALMNAENGIVAIYKAEDSIQDMILFFEQGLTESDNLNRKWQKVRIGEDETLFECVSSANAYEAERGCIFLKKNENGTLITSVWSHFPDSAPLCSHYIGDLEK